MNDSVIEIHNLSKSYTISHRPPYETFRDSAVELIKKPFYLLSRKNKAVKTEEFWALKNINLSINRGERIGIIGKNGAGKSTLLKILSQITHPTTGEIILRGRVASLLEVGTGFHPELTGRENIYLNGAILGMKQKEIAKKFDEIVAFAEIEKFLDTPVKRYSSGMYVRLAFAVAAHLEPEILIVDEVLAVGDAQFQKKCLGKMEEVGKQGRTIIFVSHNMGVVNQLCEKCILIENGKITEYGQTSRVISRYMTANIKNTSKVVFDKNTARNGNANYLFDWAELRNKENQAQTEFSMGDDIALILGLKSNNSNTDIKINIQIFASDGLAIANMVSTDAGFELISSFNMGELKVIFKNIRLYPDIYMVRIWVGGGPGGETYDEIENAIKFEIIDGGQLTSRNLPKSSGRFYLTPEWSLIVKE